MAFCMECGGSGSVLDVSDRRGPRGGYPVRGTKPCPSCTPAPVTQDFVIQPTCAGSGERVLHIPGRPACFCPVCGLRLQVRLVAPRADVRGQLECVVEAHEPIGGDFQ